MGEPAYIGTTVWRVRKHDEAPMTLREAFRTLEAKRATTTCSDCGNDFPDKEMTKYVNREGETCPACTPENIACVICGRDDLPLHTNFRCGDCGVGAVATPAPWVRGTRHPGRIVSTDTHQFVASVCAHSDDETAPSERQHANAQIICAAPDLLAFCKELVAERIDLLDSERRIRLYAALEKAGAL